MKKRFLLIVLLFIISLSLSSCSLLDDFLNQISVESYSGTTTKNSTDDDTDYPVITTTITSDDISISTSRVTGPTTSVTYINYTYTNSSIEGEHSYGYLDLNQYENKDALKSLYSNLYNKLLDFSHDYTDVSSSLINGTRVYQIIDTEFYAQYGLTEDEAFFVLKLVELDHPEFYFISNIVRISTKTVNDEPKEKTLYVDVAPDYHEGSIRQAYDININSFYNEIILLLEAEDNELTITRKVHDYILDNATYAYKTDGKTASEEANAHNIIGITSEGEGVCESYAELFTYILNKLGIMTLTVTGYGDNGETIEAHAWNYVRIDGTYYGFDLTWDDSTSSMDYFGFSSSNTDHIVTETVGIKEAKLEYLYVLPSLSDTDLVY